MVIVFPQLPEGLAFGVEAEMAEPEVSKGALVFLAIVVFTIITIYVVHLIMLVSEMIVWFHLVYACVPAPGHWIARMHFGIMHTARFLFTQQ